MSGLKLEVIAIQDFEIGNWQGYNEIDLTAAKLNATINWENLNEAQSEEFLGTRDTYEEPYEENNLKNKDADWGEASKELTLSMNINDTLIGNLDLMTAKIYVQLSDNQVHKIDVGLYALDYATNSRFEIVLTAQQLNDKIADYEFKYGLETNGLKPNSVIYANGKAINVGNISIEKKEYPSPPLITTKMEWNGDFIDIVAANDPVRYHYIEVNDTIIPLNSEDFAELLDADDCPVWRNQKPSTKGIF